MFVEQQPTSDSYETKYKYNGKELDSETGLYYYGARYYNPELSLWLSVDPLAEKYVGWSPYNYTLNNPVNYTDPNGRVVFLPAVPVILKGSALLWGAIEVGLTAYDAYSTVTDPNATNLSKTVSLGGLVLGLILPGGGYSSADDILKMGYRSDKATDAFKNLDSYDIALGTFSDGLTEMAEKKGATSFYGFAAKGFSSAAETGANWQAQAIQGIIRAREKGGKILVYGDGSYSGAGELLDFKNANQINNLLKGDLSSTADGASVWELRQIVTNKDWYNNARIVIGDKKLKLKELGIDYLEE